MDPQVPTPDAKTQARRRLIRGSFSVPAVLAVHNGSALAATSNKFLCAIKSTSGASNVAPAPGPADDGWTRVQVYEWKVSSTETRFYVLDADLARKAGELGVAYVRPSTNNTGYFAYGANLGFTYTPAPDIPDELTGSSAWVALLFMPNTAGSVDLVGFVQPLSSATISGRGAISGSCWTSIKPTP